MKQIRSFVGMDVHKATVSISVAEYGRSGPVRFIGVSRTPQKPCTRWEATRETW
jgi:hypothetical protein